MPSRYLSLLFRLQQRLEVDRVYLCRNVDYRGYAVYHGLSSFQRIFHLRRQPRVSRFYADEVVSLQPLDQHALVRLPSQLSSFQRLGYYHRIQIEYHDW